MSSHKEWEDYWDYSIYFVNDSWKVVLNVVLYNSTPQISFNALKIVLILVAEFSCLISPDESFENGWSF